MAVWRRKENKLSDHSYRKGRGRRDQHACNLSNDERNYFMARFVGNSDPGDESRGLARAQIMGTLIINSMGYTKGHICCNSKSRTQEI